MGSGRPGNLQGVSQRHFPPCGFGPPQRKIGAGMGSARFRPKAGEDGNQQRNDRRIGSRPLGFDKRQQACDGAMDGACIAQYAEMARDDRSDGGRIGRRGQRYYGFSCRGFCGWGRKNVTCRTYAHDGGLQQ